MPLIRQALTLNYSSLISINILAVAYSICCGVNGNLMGKTDYILRALSKISHKRWEHYIINRVIHTLDDPDIEFVCQQCIRKEDSLGKIYLADLLFPQLSLYLEIDEAHHDSDDARKADAVRRLDIVEATGFQEERIPASNITLSEVNKLVDEFVRLVKNKKEDLEKQGLFFRWDYDERYSAKKHIHTGYMAVGPNSVFRYHRDALQCFGYRREGHHQSGGWTLPAEVVRSIGLTGRVMVWFPRLYEAGEWKNGLSEDGKQIIEESLNATRNYQETWDYRIVMAHSRDELNRTLYRFLGVFAIDSNQSSDEVKVFKRTHTQVNVYPPKI